MSRLNAGQLFYSSNPGGWQQCLACFSGQVMKIKEDLIAQEPKHREAMEEVWTDMNVLKLLKIWVSFFMIFKSPQTLRLNFLRRCVQQLFFGVYCWYSLIFYVFILLSKIKGWKAFTSTFTFHYVQKVDKFSSHYFLGIRTSIPPHSLTLDNSSPRRKTTFYD